MLKDLQDALTRILTSNDPLESWEQEKARCSDEERPLLEAIDPDGLKMTSLIVRRLRVARVCFGNPNYTEWLKNDSSSMMKVFREYNSAVPPQHYFPEGEAASFAEFLKKTGKEPKN